MGSCLRSVQGRCCNRAQSKRGWSLQSPARACDAWMMKTNIRSSAADSEYLIFRCNYKENTGGKPVDVLCVCVVLLLF